MGIKLIDIANTDFRTSKDADDLNDAFMTRLGVKSRFIPARLAIARSLLLDANISLDQKVEKSGRAIKGDTLFGTGEDLTVWLGLIVEASHARDSVTKGDISEAVAAHWKRGLKSLEDDWNSVGQEISGFLSLLAANSKLPSVGDTTTGGDGGALPSTKHNRTIELPIGSHSQNLETEERFTWPINGSGGSPHCAIMGGVGSGKTFTARHTLEALRAQSEVPFLAFDFKGDLGSKTEKAYKLDTLFGATSLSLPRTKIPLDVLKLYDTDDVGIKSAARRFLNSFENLKTGAVGDVQAERVLEATTSALQTRKPCKIEDIKEHLDEIYEEAEHKKDGATSLMNMLCEVPLFSATMSPEDFFSQSWIIDLPNDVDETTKKFVVNIVLDALNQYLNSLPDSELSPEDNARNLRIFCLVDEAHKILKTKLPALGELIRMSRSKGGAFMLISQDPDDYSGVDQDFLSEMGLIAAFSSNSSSSAVKNIFGAGQKLNELRQFECLVKTRGAEAFRLQSIKLD